MAYNHATNMAGGMVNGRNGHRNEYHDSGSVVGYIPDDVSSVHSSSLGGVGIPSGYPSQFQGFTNDWPNLPGGRRPNGAKAKVAESLAGESVTATESDITSSIADGKGAGQGGVSLVGLTINDVNKHTSLSQSDRLKRYVESGGRTEAFRAGGNDAGSIFGGSSASIRVPRGVQASEDDDAQSVSTAFASQVGGNYD